jgi:hypothetical protein
VPIAGEPGRSIGAEARILDRRIEAVGGHLENQHRFVASEYSRSMQISAPGWVSDKRFSTMVPRMLEVRQPTVDPIRNDLRAIPRHDLQIQIGPVVLVR